ncbi:beta-Ala-His dipeptidase [Peptoniphilus sp. AGMB00490]|uniref:Cytosol non-specific dipeptidase n=1 Tax=Peptoniphilus faecalis TaxID=2731255 RepID=A0A848RP61_9FIRM|nr:beta-Ala-His dipeptidase [Peptoniphilus faecalis]NMW86062.1 beta-Ala-His dipeptidase [Peptoniphilus faecalis]
MSRIIELFKDISKIPRESGNEKEICNYILDFAKENNLEASSDKLYNVLVKKDGNNYTKNPVIIQCHTDMVCVKEDGSDHDFTKDPIDLIIDGDKISANKTSLGADNGIGVALCLYLLENNDIKHPPLEVLFTTNEETGLDGASYFDTSKIKGKTLINVDGEEAGHILLSCAGGTNVFLRKKLSYEAQDTMGYEVTIKNLLGGHSGLDIGKNRLSAIHAMSRLLIKLRELKGFRLSDFEGGEANNVIPQHGKILFTLKDDQPIKKIIKSVENELKSEHPKEKDIIKFNLEKTKINKVFSKELEKSIIDLFTILPYGVQKMSQSIDGMVQTSLTNAVLKTKDDEIELEILFRSSMQSEMDYFVNKIKNMANLVKFNFEIKSSYPAWELNTDSKIKDITAQCYEELFGKKPILESIHAGLECAVFKEKMPNIDMVSIGANIIGAHTTHEEVSIKSIDDLRILVEKILTKLE